MRSIALWPKDQMLLGLLAISAGTVIQAQGSTCQKACTGRRVLIVEGAYSARQYLMPRVDPPSRQGTLDLRDYRVWDARSLELKDAVEQHSLTHYVSDYTLRWMLNTLLWLSFCLIMLK